MFQMFKFPLNRLIDLTKGTNKWIIWKKIHHFIDIQPWKICFSKKKNLGKFSTKATNQIA